MREKRGKTANIWAILFIPALFAVGIPVVTPGEEENSAPYRSPFQVAFDPEGKRLAVSDHTAGVVVIIDVGSAKVSKEIAVKGKPSGIVWNPDGKRLFVSETGASSVAEIDPASGSLIRRLGVDLRPAGLALAPNRRLLLVANSHTNTVSAVDLEAGREKARIGVVREPNFIAVTPDEKLAVVSNALPDGSAIEPSHAASITLLDLKKLERAADIKLPAGSANVREIAVSSDGRWAFVGHSVGRTQMPTTQLDRGWVNTNGLSTIDLTSRKVHATVLLDHLMEGAAEPWGIVSSKDSKTLWITIAFTHQVARVDVEQMLHFIDGKLPDTHRLAQAANYSPGTESIWLRIKRDPGQRSELVNDLAALYSAGLIQRIPIPGKGPRGVDLSPDGQTLAVAAYYSGQVLLLDPTTCKAKATVPLGPDRKPDLVRLGEMIFHDAHYCFQHWVSCATCHPDSRTDGMNWDLLNDGIGNPKNARSLVWSYKTPPVMSLGVRSSMEEAVEAGFVHIQFHQPEEDTLRAVEAYLRSLEPESSPHLLPDGSLSEAAKRGQAIFGSEEAQCSNCHPVPLYTDMKLYDVGSKGPLDRNSSKFDTPTLAELYRTGPYLHDGSASTLRELLVDRNKNDAHGKTSHLSKEQFDDLIAFLLSL